MNRYSFLKLKTFLNTKFWVFNELNSFSSFDLLKDKGGSVLDDGGLLGQGLSKNEMKIRSLAFNRFIRILNNKKDFTSSDLVLRVTNLVRFFRSNAFLRRYWWRMARRFRCFSSFQQSVKVFRLSSF